MRFWQAFDESDYRCSAVHAAALVRPTLIVALQVAIENGLHFLDGFEPCATSLDAEVLIKQRTVQALDDAVGLRALDAGGAVLDLLELQEQLVRMLIGPAAELAAIVRQHGVDLGVALLEGGDDIIVHQVDGGNRQLARVEPGPGVARVAIDRGLQIDFADAFEHADKEGIDGEQASGMRRLDVALAELGREAFEHPRLLLGQLDLAFGRRFLQPQQAFVLGQEIVTLPDPANTAGGDLDGLEPQFLLDPHRAVAGMGKRVSEHGLLDLGRHPIGVRSLGAGQAVDQPFGSVGLEVASDLVELLP